MDLFRARVAKSGDRSALRHKVGSAWQDISWNEWDRRARQLALGLAAVGVLPGDRCSILSSTRAEWVIADMAILLAVAAGRRGMARPQPL